MQKQVIEGFRLSTQQKHLWALQQANPGPPYWARCAVRVEGDLDTDVLKAALRRVIERHEIMRTRFIGLPGVTVPLQVIAGDGSFRYDEADLRGLPPPEQLHAADRLYDEAAAAGADFEQGPLLGVSLLALADSEHVLILSLPALCADGAGLRNLVREIARSYAAVCQGDEAADEPVQYTVVSEWINEMLESEDANPGKSYWRKKDLSALGALRLAGEGQASTANEFRPASVVAAVDRPKLAKVERIAQTYDASTGAFFASCWQALLYRMTGQSEVILGAACDGRTDEELEEALGLFARHLPVVCHIEADTRFDALSRQVEEALSDNYEWQDCFTWKEIAGATADGSKQPFFPYSFEMGDEPETVAAPGVTFSVYQRHAFVERFKIKLACAPCERGLVTEFLYDAGLYRAEDIQRLAASFHTLLDSVIANPESRVGELEILSEDERRLLLGEFNRTRADYVNDRCLHRIVEQQVERTPDSAAVTFEGEHLTYAEVNRRANQLARHLRRLGVGQETVVAVCMERSIEMVLGLLAVLKAGGAYAPLDPDYPTERLAFILEDTGSPVLLCQRHLVDRLPEHAAALVCADTDWAAIGEESGDNLEDGFGVSNLAYVIYTSGSTGKPKGVMNSHLGICNRLLWMQSALPLSRDDRVLQKTAYTFDASIWELFVPLMTGARLVIARPGGHKDTAYLVSAVAEHEITVLQVVPSMLQLLLDEQDMGECRSLRRVCCGGELLPGELRQRLAARLGAELVNLYGPTEASIDAAFHVCDGSEQTPAMPIGRPITNAQLYVLEDGLRPVPIGAEGQLYIGGDGLARNYLNRPDLTAEKFIPDPFGGGAGARLYATGDLARYLPSGEIVVSGRVDNQVKIRGFRIEPGEIEAVLLGHPAVKEAVVIARADTPGSPRLVAYVAAPPDQAALVDELYALVRTQLPDYMAPSSFVLLDALPRLSNSKVDRKALPAPAEARPNLEQQYVAPRTVLELKLTQIFEESLGVQPIGVKDDFFKLGGHSMLAVRVMSRIERMLDRSLPLSTLFEWSTVEQLARLLHEQAGTALRPSLVKIQSGDGRPPFFCVHPIGGGVLCFHALALNLGQDQPFYGLQSQGMDGVQPPYHRVEDMAAHYIKELREAQPQGPYRLGGWSMGGVVAFDMARQLKAAGEDVSLLALLDTIAPTPSPQPVRVTDAELLGEFLTDIGVPLDEFLKLAPEDQFAYALEEGKKAKRFSQDVEPAHVRHYFEVFRSNVEALRNYAPGPYAGGLTLLRASDANEKGRPADPDLGWSRFAGGEVAVREFPGTHISMVVEPHVKGLAEQLRACLDATLPA